MSAPQQEHIEAAFADIVEAVSQLRYMDVELVVAALDAGWLAEPERVRLKTLRVAFEHLLPYE